MSRLCRTCFSTGFLLVLLTCFPALTSSENTTSLASSAPIEFPKNESVYPFKQNNTILEALASQTSNDTEVDDLLHGGSFANLTHPLDVSEVQEDIADETGERKWDSELIQNGDDVEEARVNRSVAIKNRDSSRPNKSPAAQGQLAAILAGVFVLLAVVGYVGLLTWRKFLEARYGNREMLVNEDDFNDPNDIRHFSI